MKIAVRYFAVLRERRGLSSETVETEADTPTALYRELDLAHHFGLDLGLVKAALNGEFAVGDVTLKAGDEVVFIPPVAGG